MLIRRFILFQIALLLIILGAFAIGAFFLPLKALLFGWPSVEESRKVVSKSAKIYLSFLQRLGLITVSIKGLDKTEIESGIIIVANHPSLLDIVFLLSIFPTSSCMAKKGLAYLSPYALIIRWTSYAAASAGSEIIEQANLELQNKRPFIIFPEGTRKSQANQQLGLYNLKFKRGAAALALRSNAPVVPVIFKYDPPVLGKNRRWYDTPGRVCNIEIEFFAPISFTRNSNQQWVQRREITQSLENIFIENSRCV